MNKKGLLYLLLQVIIGMIGVTLLKFLTDVSTVDKVFIRVVVMLIFSLIMIKIKGYSFKTNNKKILFLRTILGMIGTFAFFYSAQKVALIDISLIGLLSPIFIIIFERIFLKEKIKKEKYVLIVLTILGALLVIKPTSVSFNAFALLLVVDSIASALISVILRTIMKNGEKSEVAIFYYGIYSLIILIPLVIANGFTINSLYSLILAIGIGLCFCFKQFFYISAMKYFKASDVGLFKYLDMVFSVIFGFVIFSEVPDVYTLIGALIIVVALFADYKVEEKAN